MHIVVALMISRSQGGIRSCWQRIGCHGCLLLLLVLLCYPSRMLCWALLLYTLLLFIPLLLLLHCHRWQRSQ